jgi:hypothetical protein
MLLLRQRFEVDEQALGRFNDTLQRLKPMRIVAGHGTAEAVPFPKKLTSRSLDCDPRSLRERRFSLGMTMLTDYEQPLVLPQLMHR